MVLLILIVCSFGFLGLLGYLMLWSAIGFVRDWIRERKVDMLFSTIALVVLGVLLVGTAIYGFCSVVWELLLKLF